MATATVVIKDEVNIKIEGVDLSERKHLANKFKYDIPGARYMPAVRLGRWDGKKAFCSIGLGTYLNLLPEILPYLIERGYEIEIDDHRAHNTEFHFEEVNENSYSHVVWPEGHVMAGHPVMLRDYQVHAINNFLRQPQSISMISTGAGKTIITAVLSQKCEPYGRTVVIVPSKDLVKQTEADYINMGLDVGVLFGDRKEYTKTHTICTWQSLSALIKNSQKGTGPMTIGEFLAGVICVICDEVHSAKADVLLSMLTTEMANIPIRWGVTGTIPKEEFEARSLQVAIGEVTGTITASDLQEKGVLSNCHVHVRQLIDYTDYKDYQSELRYLLDTQARTEYIAGMIQDIGKTGNTLVLIDRVDPGKAIAACLPGAVFLSGSTKSSARKEQYDTYSTGSNAITIATYGIAAVGINIVNIHNLVLVEPGKSFVRVIQSIGRGLRKGKEKDFVQIYDVTSTCKFSKRHLASRKKFYTEAKYEYSVTKVDWQK